MEKSEAKKSVIVWLITGSPKMIIQDLYEKNCTCVWFEGKTRFEGNFNYEVLTTINPKPPVVIYVETLS